MKKDIFVWRAAAVGVVLAALIFAVSALVTAIKGRPAQAQGGAILAFAQDGTQDNRVYLVDTTQQVILLYGSTGRDFTLLAGRRFDEDISTTREMKSLPYSTRDYQIQPARPSRR